MNSAAQWTMTLRGAVVGGTECGDWEGHPVLAFHGAPGSHVEAAAFAEAAAVAAGVRLIAIDRPGIGLSGMATRRRVIDWADTVAEVADGFGLDRFAVLGASGGGPYAMACARRIPDRVSSAVLVSSPAPFDERSGDANVDGSKPAGGLMILRRFPFLARPVSARMAAVTRKPRGLMALIARMSPTDRARIADDEELLGKIADNVHMAFAQGSRGVAADMQALFGRPWGFDPADITVPVHIWHGDDDANVPVADARRLADALPNRRLDIIPGTGHLLFVDHAAAILDSIADGGPESASR
ncbi:alpha/beta fold hydrolase [Nocardia sp. NPDC127526]|uniref:alpha/beta fold hydrolase n=1 Tax=Nocardia sp. NPDC127526 TaxID=3345393 RepID=UPI00362F76E9